MCKLLAGFLIVLLIAGCGDDHNRGHGGGADGGAAGGGGGDQPGGLPTQDLLADAVTYTGTYPAPALVSFATASGRSLRYRAYPGQVQLFFARSVAAVEARAAIESNGGTVLAQIPKLGVYLAGVIAGNEGRFIAAMRSVAGLRNALPNGAGRLRQEAVIISEEYFSSGKPIPLNLPPGVVVMDSDFSSGGHGRSVATTVESSGGTVGALVNLSLQCVGCDPQQGTSGDRLGLIIAAAAQGNSIFNPGEPLVANISYGPELDLPDGATSAELAAAQAQNEVDNELFLEGILQQMVELPEALRQQVAITFALGNSNVDLTQALANLRADPTLRAILADNFVLVGTTNVDPQSGTAFSNFVTGRDPDVSISNNAEAAFGTSFAAPAVAAILQQLMHRNGLSLALAREALKHAIDGNGDGAVDLAEAIATAQQLFGTCGDGSCEPAEIGRCAVDCGSCGNGVCEDRESPQSCPQDCPLSCGDGFCNLGEGEPTSCPQDCLACNTLKTANCGVGPILAPILKGTFVATATETSTAPDGTKTCVEQETITATVTLSSFSGRGDPVDPYQGNVDVSGTLYILILSGPCTTASGGNSDTLDLGALSAFVGTVGGTMGLVTIAGAWGVPSKLDLSFPGGIWDGTKITGPMSLTTKYNGNGVANWSFDHPFTGTLVLAP